MPAYKHSRLKWLNNKSQQRLKSIKGALRYCIRDVHMKAFIKFKLWVHSSNVAPLDCVSMSSPNSKGPQPKGVYFFKTM